jgi:hypothetical protein
VKHDDLSINYTRTLRTRAANLGTLMEDRGADVLAAALRLKNSQYLYKITKAEPDKHLSEKNARRWEMLLDLPNGWFDIPR